MESRDIATLLEELEGTGLLNLYFVSLISADNILTAGDCDTSEKKLLELREAIPNSNVKEKEKWISRVEDGLKIVRRDREKYKKIK